MGSQALSTGLRGRICTPGVQIEGTPEAPSLSLIASHDARFGSATLGAGEADEVPLPEPEGEREQVWRPGFGWVDRPVEMPEPTETREVAAA